MRIEVDGRFTGKFVSEKDFTGIAPEVRKAVESLRAGTGKGSSMLGWLTLPRDYDREEFARIKAAADRIRKNCDIFVVIGIGGSYLGSRAVIEFLRSPRHNELDSGSPAIYFSGCNISGSDLDELLELCSRKDKDVSINVISKSGTTTETAVDFRCFRALLEKKYGKRRAKEHIFVTTDRVRGTLKKFADEAGYETFVVPDDVGGRYSVLSAVGLLPIAVSGIDIDKLMRGARAAMRELDTDPDDFMNNPAYYYAAVRNLLLRSGKSVEVFVGYEPFELMFSEWWKQLFGESEGKDGKGLYPASVNFTTDLHSLGQYIQDGQRTLFETVLEIVKPDSRAKIPNDPANIDGLNFLSGKMLTEVNRTAMKGTLLAHEDGGVPGIVLKLADRSELSLGYMIYFFELACAVSGYLLGVNPFDQPGVEAYKKNMFALLGKPGYEDLTDKLRSRL
ncbi:MAG: glucose-6-phosphate isomerase [Clostridia bacterium]|nr:glucose-6-phosphate isomerase [Clostridia bacterium]